MSEIFIASNDDYEKVLSSGIKKSYMTSIYVTFKCKNCNRDARIALSSFIKSPFICKGCRIVAANIKKYGSYDEYRKQIKEEWKNNVIKKYGVENVGQLQEVKDKIKATNEERYGVSSTLKIKEIHELGVKAAHSKSAQIKRVNTLINRYNVTNALNLATERDFSKAEERRKKTRLEKYGNENYNNREKMKRTNVEKFGTESFAQTFEYHQTAHKKYEYDCIVFDSSWELAFWIFHKDIGSNISRCSKRFEYYKDNKKHYYFPDFEIDDKIFEIKGSHLLKEGKLINPYTKSPDDEKLQCMIDNNVIIIDSEGIKPILSYVKSKYGNDFLSKFRRL